MRKYVWIQTQFIGWHCWPDAPEVVSYLRWPHRHLFYVQAKVKVDGNERDVEFHLLKRDVDILIEQHIPGQHAEKPANWSCEQMAETLGLELGKLGYSVESVVVSEDSENGAEIIFS